MRIYLYDYRSGDCIEQPIAERFALPNLYPSSLDTSPRTYNLTKAIYLQPAANALNDITDGGLGYDTGTADSQRRKGAQPPDRGSLLSVPQLIVRQKGETVGVISYAEYRKLLIAQQKLTNFFGTSHLVSRQPICPVIEVTYDRIPKYNCPFCISVFLLAG